jgi:hypothetical protein
MCKATPVMYFFAFSVHSAIRPEFWRFTKAHGIVAVIGDEVD